MNTLRLVNALNYIDDELILDAVADTGLPKGRRSLRWSIAAACLLLLFGTVTVAASTGLGTRIIEMFTSRTEPDSDYSESGYVLGADVIKVSAASFKGKINEVPQIIRKQLRDYKPYSSLSPNSWQKEFASSSEARAFIGFPPLRGLDWDLEEGTTHLRVTGDANGELQALVLETDYRVGDVRLQAFAHVYTDKCEGEITYSTVTTEDIEFCESFYTTDRQLKCHVISSTALESGYMSMDGFLVQDGLLYSLHIAYLEKDTKQARELLRQWAELFAG